MRLRADTVLARLLQAAGVAISAASLMALGARFSWWFELASHFRVQYLVLLILLTIALLGLRRRRLLPLLVAAMLVNLYAILQALIPAFTGGDEVQTARPITIVTANVQRQNRDYERISSLLIDTDADVVLVVELTPPLAAELETLESVYPHQVLGAADDAFGIGLLSRFPLATQETVPLEATNAIETVLQTPAGPLSFVGVHLLPPTDAARSAGRNQQLMTLARRARDSDDPLVVCGDYNISPYSPIFEEFLESSGLEQPRVGRRIVSWPTFFPMLGVLIDHCLTSPDIIVQSATRLEEIGSDHYPMHYELRMPPADRSPD